MRENKQIRETVATPSATRNRKALFGGALILALAVLAYPALAQMTNTLPATYVYPLSATNGGQPGFIWNVYQVSAPSSASLAWFESELVGLQGTDLADPTQAYSASGNGTTSGPLSPVSFVIPGTINFSINANGTAGPDCTDNRQDLPCETGMVGTPGNPPDAGQGVDNIAAEALTYLALPAGPVTMGVRSDDGFKVQIGGANPGDRYSTNAELIAQFNAGRGAGDTIVTFNVPTAGLYAARLLYFQNGGGASVEWFTIPPEGSTNGFLGMLNTGTNAVLVGDVADGGIPAYRSIGAAPLSSYVSSFIPSPGMTGLPITPVSISATIVNGTVPVSQISLTIDGTAVTPTITTTANGATVSYTTNSPLANLSTHTAVLSWNDNGKTLSVSSDFSMQGYLTLDPSTIVTPDTTKPGFRFNIFANSADPFGSSQNGVQGGENDNLDNIELGLNGLVPDGSGGYLSNAVNLTLNGAATAPAPALGGPNAPAEFIITNVIDLGFATGTVPGIPTLDGSGGPSHSEILTYVHLPVGLTTFTLNVDGFYRAFAGSWDYTKGMQVGRVNDTVSGNTSFSVYASTAGYYPFRFTVMNLDAVPQISLYTASAAGTNVLVNDIAHGGLPAYYALSTPSKPYVRYTSPRPVPRQVEYPNNRVLVRLQDADTQVNDSTAVFNLDGKNVTVTKNRLGDVLELSWTATTLQTPAEIHTGILTCQDSGGSTVSNYWTFLNLKAVWLPNQTPGTWLPINAVASETFQEYANPTDFETNDPPTTGQWYTSAQPSNPLVDIAPKWTNNPAGPNGWYVWNFSAPGDGNAFDPTDPNGPAYANFLCVDLTTFANIESDAANTAPYEMINGVAVTSLVADPSKNIFIAESDNRDGSSPGQVQFAISKSFDLSGVTNPVLAFAAIQKQNQDNINAIEYSVDGGATWAPVIYYLDGHKLAATGDPADLQLASDNTVDVNKTLFHDINPGEIPTWTDATGNVNNTFASGIAAPISQALAPFFAPRVNDDKYDGKRIEVVRLPLAAHKSNVRLRLSQIGTCSWYFGIAQIAFYDVPPSGAIVPTGLPNTTTTQPVLSVSTSGGNLTVTWTGSGTLQSASKLTGSPSDWTAVSPQPPTNSYTTPIGPGALFFRVQSN